MPIASKVSDNRYKVFINKEDMEHYDEDDWCEIKDVFNGIFQFLKEQGWREGYRNNIAVDLLITANELNLIDTEIESYGVIDRMMKDLVHDGVIDDNAYMDYQARRNVISSYLNSWKGSAMLYWLDPDTFNDYSYAPTDTPITLVFTDEDL